MLISIARALSEIEDEWAKLGLEYWMFEKEGVIYLKEIRLHKSKRHQGIGTTAMNLLCEYADEKHCIIVLSPSTDFGATSVARLIRFYKRFGFVENRGRRKDYRFTDWMIRRPIAKISISAKTKIVIKPQYLSKDDGMGTPEAIEYVKTWGEKQFGKDDNGKKAAEYYAKCLEKGEGGKWIADRHNARCGWRAHRVK